MSCSTLIFTEYLTFIILALKTKGHQDVASWKECSSLMLKLSYMELVIWMVSDRCHHISVENLKFAVAALWICWGSPYCIILQLGYDGPTVYPPSAPVSAYLVLTMSSVSGIEPCRKCLQGSPSLGGEQLQCNPDLAMLEIRAGVMHDRRRAQCL